MREKAAWLRVDRAGALIVEIHLQIQKRYKSEAYYARIPYSAYVERYLVYGPSCLYLAIAHLA